MLSKTIAKTFLQRSSPIMGAAAARGAYTDQTRPYVFINEHTKVICQGMTGKHVSRRPFANLQSSLNVLTKERKERPSRR